MSKWRPPRKMPSSEKSTWSRGRTVTRSPSTSISAPFENRNKIRDHRTAASSTRGLCGTLRCASSPTGLGDRAFLAMVSDDCDRFPGAIEELREVLLIDREYERTTGGRWIVATVEVWVEMLVLRVAEVGPTTSGSVPSLTDDRGNRYRFAGGGGSGNEQLRVMSFVFRPSLHPRTTKLWLRPDEEQQLEIALPPRPS